MCMYNEPLFSHKRKEILTSCDNMGGPLGIMLNEIRQRKINTGCSHLYVESNLKKTNLHPPKRIDKEIIFVVVTSGKVWGRGDWRRVVRGTNS